MKFGPRKPSLKRSIKARTAGKLKRKAKKAVNPLYGKKGMGIVRNPKKAVYNKVYNKTTFDALKPLKKSAPKKKRKANTANVQKNVSTNKPRKSNINLYKVVMVILILATFSYIGNGDVQSALVSLAIIGLLYYFGYHKKRNKQLKFNSVEEGIIHFQNALAVYNEAQTTATSTYNVDEFFINRDLATKKLEEALEIVEAVGDRGRLEGDSLEKALLKWKAAQHEVEQAFVERYFARNTVQSDDDLILSESKEKLLSYKEQFRPETLQLINDIYK